MADARADSPKLLSSERVERLVIERVTPQVESGRWAAKAVVAEQLPVRACVFSDGQPVLFVLVRWRMRDGEWRCARLRGRIDDFWTGNVRFERLGSAEFQIEAWRDQFASWRQDYRRWLRAKADPRAELPTGLALVRSQLAWLPEARRGPLLPELDRLEAGPAAPLERFLLSPPTLRLMQDALRSSEPTRSAAMPVVVERERALFGAWYEMFPRSEGASEGRSGTLRTAARRLPALAAMNFDIVYLPPIHPIGTTARRGRNNHPRARPGEPGSPWAIGSNAGGHTTVHPDLGTLEDFRFFRERAEALGMEVALDYALQCSPDHPWVREHPEWFEHRPDGSVRPAENPPKRYDDVFPLDFACPDWRGLWHACYEILEFWIEQGVRAFRVDNPHTKPVRFWAWVFEQLRHRHPDVIMLAEAFTRPALMDELSKVGFSQSYTYFTWRTSKRELRRYLTHLTRDSADFLRPNFFANTPDILTHELQRGGPAAFRYRLALAATLSPAYGIYSGFELCENRPQHRGSEEYRDSEKYQYRPRAWGDAGSLAPLIARLNQIRRQHPALQQLRRLHFHRSDNPKVIAYSKRTQDRSDVVLAVVNLDPRKAQRARLDLTLRELGERPSRELQVEDLLNGGSTTWRGSHQEVTLDPAHGPCLLLSVRT